MLLFGTVQVAATLRNLGKALAGEEAGRVKRLMGSLRALFRSSPETGHHPRVTELKSCLRASARKAKDTACDDGSAEEGGREGGERDVEAAEDAVSDCQDEPAGESESLTWLRWL